MSGGGPNGVRAYRIVRWLTGLTVIVTALALPAGGGSTPLQGPQCGDTVTASVVLQNDLVCNGDGLYLQSSSSAITVDMHGHSILGSGAGAGLYVLPSAADIVVENGTVSGFASGILNDAYSPTLTLDNLSITGNQGGVGSIIPGPTTLTNSTVARNHGDGVDTGTGGDFEIINDHIQNNGGDGINAHTDSLRLIANSFIAHNGGDGAYVSETVSTIGGNTFLGNGGVGLFIIDDACFYLDFYNVSDNVADQNGEGGMFAFGSPQTCTSIPGDGNAAQNNTNVQCTLIVCAKNRGQANQKWEAAPLIRHNR